MKKGGRIRIYGKLRQADLRSSAMIDAGLDPARFGRQLRSRVETDRKRQARSGYRKHRLRKDGEE